VRRGRHSASEGDDLSSSRLLALALSAAVVAGSAVALEPGKALTDPKLHPWAALVTIGGSVCSGSLIDEHWVLTARHCLPTLCGIRNVDEQPPDPRLAGVQVRIHGKTSTFPVFAVECATAGPAQPRVPWPDDIALLKVQYVGIPERRLPTLAAEDLTPASNAWPAGKYLVAVGWSDGAGGARDEPQALKLVPLGRAAGSARLAAPGACAENLALGANQLVAVASGPAPSVFYGLQEGDSGGPLVRQGKPRPTVVAVASAACSNIGLPIYDDVYDHRCWIAETACGFYNKKKLRNNCWKRLLAGFDDGCKLPAPD
jgi:secreted trypsin-like serine protease